MGGGRRRRKGIEEKAACGQASNVKVTERMAAPRRKRKAFAKARLTTKGERSKKKMAHLLYTTTTSHKGGRAGIKVDPENEHCRKEERLALIPRNS